MSTNSPLAHLLAGIDVETHPADAVSRLRDAFPADRWPAHAVSPNTYEAAAQALQAFAREGLAVLPLGSGGNQALGNPPTRGDVFLCTDRLAHIVEHDADNMTVIAQAGARLSDVQAAVLSKGQVLPLDPRFAHHATIGGVLAANANGFTRASRGAVRDAVLGLKVALPNGKVIAPGGRTVKNVAGYDLCKLFVGSLGTLGLIVEATLRLIPKPQATETLALACESADAVQQLAAALTASPLTPTATVWLNPQAARHLAGSLLPDSRDSVVLRFDGVAEAVQRQTRDAASLCAGAKLVASLAADAADALWAALEEGSGLGSARCKVTVAPTRLSKALHRASEGAVVCDLLSGVAWAFLDGDDAQVVRKVTELRADAESAGGSLVVEAARLAVRAQVDAWGATRQTIALMKQVKAAFDPQGALNPGRFVGGI